MKVKCHHPEHCRLFLGLSTSTFKIDIYIGSTCSGWPISIGFVLKDPAGECSDTWKGGHSYKTVTYFKLLEPAQSLYEIAVPPEGCYLQQPG